MDMELVLLIAEDDDNHFLLTKRYLERKGITSRIVRFTDGRALLNFLSAIESSDSLSEITYLLLLDINMPKVTGLEVLRRIKQNQRLKNLPIIILTSFADRQIMDRCYSLGCNAYFTKPLQGDDFIDTLKRLSVHLPSKQSCET